MTPSLLAKLALLEWQQRLAAARAMVAGGRATAEEADARLYPWLAIALTAGATPPEAAALFEEVRREGCAEHWVRSQAVFQLCDDRDMRAELTRARDTALAAALAHPGDTARSGRAAGLQYIACYLGCPPAECANDQPERIAA